MVSAAMPFRSARASWPWPTCSTRSPPIGPIVRLCRRRPRSPTWSPRPDARSMPMSSPRSWAWCASTTARDTMLALDEPAPRPPLGLLHGTPVAALGVLAATWTAAVMVLADPAVRVLGLATAHGAMLGTAVAWTSPGAGSARRAPVEAAFLLAVAAGCAHLHPWGALAYVVV